jgi:pSer/pThr/pTyr-binding forkhead associated (FHA) protein
VHLLSRRLVISDGTREREMQLVGRVVVGRDPTCDISHDHSLLSRRHAEFVTTGNDVTVRDLGSRNGVFVNGVKAAERSLSPGDVVQIGPLRALRHGRCACWHRARAARCRANRATPLPVARDGTPGSGDGGIGGGGRRRHAVDLTSGSFFGAGRD